MKNLIKLKSFKNSAFLLLAIGMSPTGAVGTKIVCHALCSLLYGFRSEPVEYFDPLVLIEVGATTNNTDTRQVHTDARQVQGIQTTTVVLPGCLYDPEDDPGVAFHDRIEHLTSDSEHERVRPESDSESD